MTPPVAGKAIYVLNGVFDKEFLEKQKLKVVYHGPTTDVLVAVDPRKVQ
jgi:hypothetical protein